MSTFTSKNRRQLKDVTILREFGGAQVRFNMQSIDSVEFLVTSHAVLSQRHVEWRLSLQLPHIITLSQTVTTNVLSATQRHILQNPPLSLS